MTETKRDEESPEIREEAERAARAVSAGSDAIEVPATLLAEDEPPVDEQANQSLYAQVQGMTIAQKVKLALKGNKDARMILIRSANRMVQRMVLQNPRITEEEILGLAKNRSADDEVLRMIADNRDWTSSYAIRTALVENAKTPLPKALRFLPTLAEREIRVLAKSKNVPHVISAQARKILFQKDAFRQTSR